MPITLVITDLDVGGAERALVGLALGLDRGRWDPVVIGLGAEGRLAEPLRAAGIATTCLDVDRRRPLRAVGRLAAAFRRRPPDLVQSFLFHANVASRIAARLAGVHWVVGGIRVAERQKPWHLGLERLTAGLSAGSVCVSKGVARFSREVGRWPAGRLTVIPNGIDPSPFDRAQPVPRTTIGVPAESVLALFVGRLDAQKGLPFLLEAAERVARIRSDWHLAVVGDGPLREVHQQDAAARAALTGRIHWLGRRDDVPALLKSADLLVLPSLWEGMPNAVLEAMAAGRAVVATEVEGSEDLVLPGQTGWLVPPGDAGALAEALLDASVNPSRLERYGRAGRERVEQCFSIKASIAAYEDLWSRLLGLPTPGSSPRNVGSA